MLILGCMFIGMFTACSSNMDVVNKTASEKTVDKQAEEKPEAQKAEDETAEDKTAENEGMENPVKEKGINDIAEEWGIVFSVPTGADKIKETYIESENPIIQREFELEGREFTARAAKTNELEDISGMNYEWTIIDAIEINGFSGETKRYISDEETVDVCIYYNSEKGVTYSLSLSAPNLDGFDISAAAGQISKNHK